MYVDVGALQVRDLMNPKPETVGRTASVGEVLARMRAKGARYVPVLALGRTVAGVVSVRDMLKLGVSPFDPAPSEARMAVLNALPVTDYMTKVVETVTPEHKAVTAAARMHLLSLGCLPVVDGQHLVGLITEEAFVQWFGQQDMGKPATPFKD